MSLPSELQDVLETAQTVKTGLYTIGLSSIFFLICIIVIFFFFLFRHAEGLAVKRRWRVHISGGESFLVLFAKAF